MSSSERLTKREKSSNRIFGVSRTKPDRTGNRSASAYALFGVTARTKSLWRTLDLSVSLDNLFGKAYYDPSVRSGVPGDYPRPGRRVLVHATYKF